MILYGYQNSLNICAVICTHAGYHAGGYLGPGGLNEAEQAGNDLAEELIGEYLSGVAWMCML